MATRAKSPAKSLRSGTRVARLATLGEKADSGDEQAMSELTDLATARGLEPDNYATWAELDEQSGMPADPHRKATTRSAPVTVKRTNANGAMSRAASISRKTALSTWEGIWYVLMCIPMGAGYFAKIPAKKALHDFGLAELTGAERFWYVLGCIPFGLAYFSKIPMAKALSELPQYRSERQTRLGTLGG